MACKAYEQFRNHPNMFYIDKEINLEDRTEIIAANEWISRIFEEGKKKSEIDFPPEEQGKEQLEFGLEKVQA